MQVRIFLTMFALFLVASTATAQKKADPRSSVPTGINKRFLGEDFNAEAMMKRWEMPRRRTSR